jgi:FkbM family methyltransferase
MKILGRNIYTRQYNRKVYYDLNTDIGQKILRVGNFERAELEIIGKYIKKDSVVFDIGANIGTHTLFVANKSTNGKIYSFEPSRNTYSFLLKNIAGLKNVFPINMAVSDISGISTFYNATDNAYSGLKETGKKPIFQTENVLVVRIDDFVNIQKIERLDFLKIDVEGFEHQVINGSMETLKRFKPIIMIEICKDQKSKNTPEETINAIINLGYDAFVISGWEMIPFTKVNDKDYNYVFIANTK